MKRARPHRLGFTLVELLVVIGIIALLIGILLPSLNRAREASKRVKCLANMRSVGQQLMMYVNENRGSYPTSYWRNGSALQDFGLPEVRTNWDWLNTGAKGPGVNFLGSLVEMNDGLAEAVVCPSSTLNGGVEPQPNQPITSYLPNGVFVNRRISAVPGSAEYAMMQEHRYSHVNEFYRPDRYRVQPNISTPDKLLSPFNTRDRYDSWANAQNGVVNAENNFGSVHSNGGNFLFADGHAAYQRFNDTTALLFGLVGSDVVKSNPTPSGKTADGYEQGKGNNYGAIFENPL